MNKLSTAVMLRLAVALLACGPVAGNGTNGESVSDYADLLERLRAEGATVQVGDAVSQDFFSVEGQTLTLGDDQIQVFEYADEAAAAREAQLISPDGASVGTTMIQWVAQPHFYRAGRLIVLYLGDNTDTRQLLEMVLGPQFAGM